MFEIKDSPLTIHSADAWLALTLSVLEDIPCPENKRLFIQHAKRIAIPREWYEQCAVLRQIELAL